VQDIEPTFLVFPHVKNLIKKIYFYASPYTPEKSMIAYVVSLILQSHLRVYSAATPIRFRIRVRHGGICILPVARYVFISYLRCSLHTIVSIYTQLAYTISPPNEVVVRTATRNLSLDSSYLPLRFILLILILRTS
jgi:hypothetical protein